MREIAEVEFVDTVVETITPDINGPRIILTDESFVDEALGISGDLPQAFFTPVAKRPRRKAI